MKKELTKQPTFEITLANYKRYIEAIANSFGQDKYKEDLKQEGSLGLLDAYNRYDETKGPFNQYAMVYIRDNMRKFLSNNARTIRLPNNVLWTDEDLSYLSTISLQTTLGVNGGIIEDVIPADEETISYDTSILKSLLRYLKPDDLELIKLKYNLTDDGEEMTNTEIGKLYGTTPENIRIKLMRIMRILKENTGNYDRSNY